MTLLRSPIFNRSLRAKVLAPLLASTVLTVVLGVALTRVTFGRMLDAQLDHRVKLLADAVNYAAEATSASPALARIVNSLGGEADVSAIVVAVDDPPVVVASTQNAWIGMEVSDVPDETIRHAVLAASSRVHERLPSDGDLIFDYIIPFSLNGGDLRDGGRVHGSIYVQLDASRFNSSQASSSARVIWLMLLGVSGVGILALGLFHYKVLRPLSSIRVLLDHRSSGDYCARATIDSRDEIGTLAAALNDMLDTVDAGRAELHKLALVASRTDSGVVIADKDAQVEWVNQAFSRIRHWSFEDAPPTDLVDLIIPEDVDSDPAKELRSCIAEGLPLRRELETTSSEGDSRWLALELQPIYADDHRLTNFVVLCTDITDRRDSEERLRAREARLKLVNQISTSMIYDASPEQIIQSTVQTLARCFPELRTSYANVSNDGLTTIIHSVAPTLGQLLFQKSFSISSATVLRSSLEQRNAIVIGNIQDDPDATPVRESLEEFGIRSLVAAPVVHNNCLVGVLLLDSEQTRVWSDHEIETLTDAADYLSLAHRDAHAKAERIRSAQKLQRFNTELLEAKALLESQKDELAAANKELVVTSLAAASANKSKSEFLANMSHEIRTPMTAILGYADLLTIDDQTRDELHDRVETIKRNGEHLMDVINDILDLSKVEAGKLTIELDDFAPRNMIDNIIDLLRQRADDKNIDLEAILSDDVPAHIRSDPIRLRQVLVNLIGNAIKFTDSGSVKIFIKAIGTAADHELEVKIIDTGIGLSKAQITTIFEPFKQADSSTTRRFGGTGLGLTISKKLANALDGDITIESVEGQGATFIFNFGYQDPQTCLTGLSQFVAETPREQGLDLESARILLVEDGVDNQRLISFHLEKAGADVQVAENGQLGVDAVTESIRQDRPFSLILMDMQMPVMDGYAASGAIRALGIKTPIIALTAHAMSSDRQRCLDAGCDDYESKPIKRNRLIRVCRRWLHPDERNKAA